MTFILTHSCGWLIISGRAFGLSEPLISYKHDLGAEGKGNMKRMGKLVRYLVSVTTNLAQSNLKKSVFRLSVWGYTYHFNREVITGMGTEMVTLHLQVWWGQNWDSDIKPMPTDHLCLAKFHCLEVRHYSQSGALLGNHRSQWRTCHNEIPTMRQKYWEIVKIWTYMNFS